MIDGYSVQEAASVLGVPEGRVWELLARGVLSGTPEGDSMRVYLKADPGPIATASPRDEPRKTNGNAGSHANGGEASAFRELLTEFRNLTERYGQALLALGEARGEVAGLRSRVELLEARLDLRLPTSPDASPLAWEAPAVAPVALESPVAGSAAAEPTPPSAEPAPMTPAPVRRTSRPQKARPTRRTRPTPSTRSAVEGFAQALARAQDPTTADVGDILPHADSPLEPDIVETSPVEGVASEWLPEPTIAADAEPEPAMAELEVASTEPEPVPADLAHVSEYVSPELESMTAELEVASAEPEPMAAEFDDASAQPEPEPEDAIAEPQPAAAELEVASAEPEAAQPTYSAAVVEPDWFADGDFAWLEASDLEAKSPSLEGAGAPGSAEPEPADESPPEPIAATEAETGSWARSEPIAEPDRPAMPDLPQMPDLPPALDLPPAPEVQLQPSLEPAAQIESGTQPEPKLAQSVAVLTEPSLQIDPIESADAVEPVGTEGPSNGPREEEVMWLGAEYATASSEIEVASTGWHAEPRSVPTLTEAPPVARAEPPLLRMTEEELARLARDEGWDDAEVAAIRAMIVPPSPRSVQLPGAAELDDAMAALRAVPADANMESNQSREWAKPPGDARAARYDDWAFEVESVAPPSPPVEPLAPRRQPTDPGWLRQRQGPAATAYRRLRRLFPG